MALEAIHADDSCDAQEWLDDIVKRDRGCFAQTGLSMLGLIHLRQRLCKELGKDHLAEMSRSMAEENKQEE